MLSVAVRKMVTFTKKYIKGLTSVKSTQVYTFVKFELKSLYDRVSWPRTYCVEQAGLILTQLSLPLPGEC